MTLIKSRNFISDLLRSLTAYGLAVGLVAFFPWQGELFFSWTALQSYLLIGASLTLICLCLHFLTYPFPVFLQFLTGILLGSMAHINEKAFALTLGGLAVCGGIWGIIKLCRLSRVLGRLRYSIEVAQLDNAYQMFWRQLLRFALWMASFIFCFFSYLNWSSIYFPKLNASKNIVLVFYDATLRLPQWKNSAAKKIHLSNPLPFINFLEIFTGKTAVEHGIRSTSVNRSWVGQLDETNFLSQWKKGQEAKSFFVSPHKGLQQHVFQMPWHAKWDKGSFALQKILWETLKKRAALSTLLKGAPFRFLTQYTLSGMDTTLEVFFSHFSKIQSPALIAMDFSTDSKTLRAFLNLVRQENMFAAHTMFIAIPYPSCDLTMANWECLEQTITIHAPVAWQKVIKKISPLRPQDLYKVFSLYALGHATQTSHLPPSIIYQEWFPAEDFTSHSHLAPSFINRRWLSHTEECIYAPQQQKQMSCSNAMNLFLNKEGEYQVPFQKNSYYYF